MKREKDWRCTLKLWSVKNRMTKESWRELNKDKRRPIHPSWHSPTTTATQIEKAYALSQLQGKLR